VKKSSDTHRKKSFGGRITRETKGDFHDVVCEIVFLAQKQANTQKRTAGVMIFCAPLIARKLLNLNNICAYTGAMPGLLSRLARA
jgi:hypothetical protein